MDQGQSCIVRLKGLQGLILSAPVRGLDASLQEIKHSLPKAARESIIFFKGKKLKNKQTLTDIGINPSQDFLTIVPRDPKSLENLEPPQGSLSASIEPSTACTGSKPASQQAVFSHGGGFFGSDGLHPVVRNASSLSPPSTPTGKHHTKQSKLQCSVSPGNLLPSSPRWDTLLPGYASRPQPSPAKTGTLSRAQQPGTQPLQVGQLPSQGSDISCNVKHVEGPDQALPINPKPETQNPLSMNDQPKSAQPASVDSVLKELLQEVGGMKQDSLVVEQPAAAGGAGLTVDTNHQQQQHSDCEVIVVSTDDDDHQKQRPRKRQRRSAQVPPAVSIGEGVQNEHQDGKGQEARQRRSRTNTIEAPDRRSRAQQGPMSNEALDVYKSDEDKHHLEMRKQKVIPDTLTSADDDDDDDAVESVEGPVDSKQRRTRSTKKHADEASAGNQPSAVQGKQRKSVAKKQELQARKLEAAVTALPLPPELESLYETFTVVVPTWKLLLSRHVQPTFKLLAAAVNSIKPDTKPVQADHIFLLSKLVPDVVRLRDRTKPHAESDLGSPLLAAGNTLPPLNLPEMLGIPFTSHHSTHMHGKPAAGLPGWHPDDGGSLAGRITAQGWSSRTAERVANSAAVLSAAVSKPGMNTTTTDGSGMVFLGEQDAIVLDLMDPGKWVSSHGQQTQGNNLVPEMPADEQQTNRDSVADDKKLGKGASGIGNVEATNGSAQGDKVLSAGSANQEAELLQYNNSSGALGKNMAERCCIAVRKALVLSVMKMHAAWAIGNLNPKPNDHSAVPLLPKGTKKQTTATIADLTDVPTPPKEAASWDPVKQRSFHPQFMTHCFYRITLRDVRASVRGDHELSGAPRAPRLLKRAQACTSCEPYTTRKLLEHFKDLAWYEGQVVHVQEIPARPAKYATPRHPLSFQVQTALASRGLSKLYCHQAQAIDALMDGHHTAVATSTASGKSLCYNIPIMEALVANPAACAIYIFPTKALAQDQLRALRDMMTAAFGNTAPSVEVYDGDTPQEARPVIREQAQLLITNPDMLHRSILPFHGLFRRLLSNLTMVVLDEGHAYHGVFGAHTALVMRRLQRLCDQIYGCSPRFCVTSATTANPAEHACRLTGVTHVTLVTEDGSPTGPKQFVLWNPPLSIGQLQHSTANAGKKPKDAESVGRQAGRQLEQLMPRKYLPLLEAEQKLNVSGLSDDPSGKQQDVEAIEISDGDDDDHVRQAPERGNKQAASSMPMTSTTKLSRTERRAIGKANNRALRNAARQALREANAARQRGTKLSEGLGTWTADAGLSALKPGLKHQLFGSPTKHARVNIDEQPTTPVEDKEVDMTPTTTKDRLWQSMQPHRESDVVYQPDTELQPQPQPKLSRRQLIDSALAAISAVSKVSPSVKHLPGGSNLTNKDEGQQPRQDYHLDGQPCKDQLSIQITPQDADVRPVITLSKGWSVEKAQKEAARFNDQQPSSKANKKQPSARKPPTGREPLLDKDEPTEIAQRMPPPGEWKKRDNVQAIYGAAGTPEDQKRDSPMVELALLLAECMQHGLRTIAFCKTRKLAELVGAYTRETLKATAPDLQDRLKVYRGGYAPMDRRDIEQGLHNGKYLAVAATNALELGVDIGGLDATLHLGFQGSLASLRQQAGRAGRREQSSIAVYIAFDSPLDQYFMTHPAQLFDKPVEHAQIDIQNPHVLQQHIMCAAAEWPLDVSPHGRDFPYFGPRMHFTSQLLLEAGLLSKDPTFPSHAAPLMYCGGKEVPAADVSLRTIDDTHFDIVLEGGRQVLEQVEMANVFYEVYDGAIYMFQGRPFLCKKLDLAARTAVVRPVDVKYYTKIRDYTDVHVTGGSKAYQAPSLTRHGSQERQGSASFLLDPPMKAPIPPPNALFVPPAVAKPTGPQQPLPHPVTVQQHQAQDTAARQVAAAADPLVSTDTCQGHWQQHNQPHTLAQQQQQQQRQQQQQKQQQQEQQQQQQQVTGCCHHGDQPHRAVKADWPPDNLTWPMPTTASCEEAIVTVRYMGFHRVWQGTGQVFDSVDLWLPDVRFETQAAYIRVPRTARTACQEAGLSFRDGVHAASHAVLNVLPLLVTCNPRDMGAECDNPYDTRYKPERILLYDKHPGGIGLAAQATPLFHELLQRALALVEACPCAFMKGCPACVQHIDCKNYNAVLNKRAGLIVLRSCLEAEREWAQLVCARQKEVEVHVPAMGPQSLGVSNDNTAQ